MTNNYQEVEELVEIIVKGIQEKKGSNISILNLKKLDKAVTKYFIICDADSNTQVNAIAHSVEDTVRKDLHEKVWNKNGYENAIWILLDYVDVVVHVFQKPYRDFYDLEGLWIDAEAKQIRD